MSYEVISPGSTQALQPAFFAALWYVGEASSVSQHSMPATSALQHMNEWGINCPFQGESAEGLGGIYQCQGLCPLFTHP